MVKELVAEASGLGRVCSRRARRARFNGEFTVMQKRSRN